MYGDNRCNYECSSIFQSLRGRSGYISTWMWQDAHFLLTTALKPDRHQWKLSPYFCFPDNNHLGMLFLLLTTLNSWTINPHICPSLHRTSHKKGSEAKLSFEALLDSFDKQSTYSQNDHNKLKRLLSLYWVFNLNNLILYIKIYFFFVSWLAAAKYILPDSPWQYKFLREVNCWGRSPKPFSWNAEWMNRNHFPANSFFDLLILAVW